MKEHIAKFDNVNHPEHYASGTIECIDAMESAFGAFPVAYYCRINAFKYIWRAGKKGDSKEKYIEDLEKADWYIKKCIELLKKT